MDMNPRVTRLVLKKQRFTAWKSHSFWLQSHGNHVLSIITQTYSVVFSDGELLEV
jgi:hypothetical protein